MQKRTYLGRIPAPVPKFPKMKLDWPGPLICKGALYLLLSEKASTMLDKTYEAPAFLLRYILSMTKGRSSGLVEPYNHYDGSGPRSRTLSSKSSAVKDLMFIVNDITEVKQFSVTPARPKHPRILISKSPTLPNSENPSFVFMCQRPE